MIDNGVDNHVTRTSFSPRKYARRRWQALLVALSVLAAGAIAVVAAPAATAASIDTTAWYVLVNRNSGKALDVYNLSTADGAPIKQWTRNDANQQQWQFVDVGNGYYKVKSRLSGKVLDVTAKSTADGAIIEQWTDNGGTNQQFSIQDIDGYIQLIARVSGKAVEVSGASTADGGNVVQYSDWNGTNQQWQLAKVGSGSTTTTPPTNSGTFTNPVVWQDFADGDIIRVGDAYYYSASTMHYSPGAPILRSYDLVNWEYAGHSVPRLDFDDNGYDLNGGRKYVKGIWASTLGYRKSNSTYYWLGCTEFNRTYVYTSTSVDGTWSKKARINNCYYDAGLLIDDNDTMYVAYGNSKISVAQLSRRRHLPGALAAGVPDAVERRHPRGLPVLQARQLLLHLAHPAGQRPVRAALDLAVRPVRDEGSAAQPARPDLGRRRAAPGWPRPDAGR